MAQDSTDDRPTARAVTANAVQTFRDPVDGVELTTVPGAALLTGRAVRTIYGWIERKLVSVRYTPSGQYRVVVTSLFRRG